MSIDDEWQSGVVPRNDAAQPMTYGDGYFIVPQVGRILYATSPDGPWSIEDLPIGEVNVFHVVYGDGNWVAATFDGILTAPSPSGPWTMRLSRDDGGGSEVVAYGDGKWVCLAGGNVATATDPTGTWTVNSQGFTFPRWLAYGDGKFVIVGLNGMLFYTTTPAGSWTDGSTGGTADYHAIAYGNGDWILAGGTDGFVGSAVAKTATSPGGSWTTVTTGTTAKSYPVGGVSYLDGLWVLPGYSRAELWFASAPSGPWESVELPRGASSYAATVYNDGEWGVNLGSEVGFQTGAGDGWGVILT